METKIQFHKNATVVTTDGREVGTLDRVVFSPTSRMVTHIVVRTGNPLNKVDRVLPIEVVSASTEDKIVMLEAAGDLDAFPLFEEQRLVGKKSGLDLPPVAGSSTPELIGYPEPDIPVTPTPGEEYVTQKKQNIPTGTVALKAGAQVSTADGKHVGKVERILANPEMDQVTHLLVSRGLFPKETKLIPMEWVSTMTEDEVHLEVAEHEVTELDDVSIAR